MIKIKENPIKHDITFGCLNTGDIYQFIDNEIDDISQHYFLFIKDGLSFNLTLNTIFGYSTPNSWMGARKVKIFDGDLYVHERSTK